MAQNIQETNKELIGKFVEEIFVKKDLTKLDEYMHQDYIQHNPLVEQGLKGFRVFFQNWFSSAPDFNYTLKKLLPIRTMFGRMALTQEPIKVTGWVSLQPINPTTFMQLIFFA